MYAVQGIVQVLTDSNDRHIAAGAEALDAFVCAVMTVARAQQHAGVAAEPAAATASGAAPASDKPEEADVKASDGGSKADEGTAKKAAGGKGNGGESKRAQRSQRRHSRQDTDEDAMDADTPKKGTEEAAAAAAAEGSKAVAAESGASAPTADGGTTSAHSHLHPCQGFALLWARKAAREYGGVGGQGAVRTLHVVGGVSLLWQVRGIRAAAHIAADGAGFHCVQGRPQRRRPPQPVAAPHALPALAAPPSCPAKCGHRRHRLSRQRSSAACRWCSTK